MSKKPFPPDVANSLVMKTLALPVVFKDMVSDWPCMNWTIPSLADVLGSQQLKFRIGPRSWSQHGVLWETDCCYRDATLQQFRDWLNAATQNLSEDNPLKDFESTDSWCYADYKHMSQIFQGKTDILEAVRWSDFGFQGRDGTQSTLWIGSEGSHTPCHYDTYGCNLVVQICGEKQWYLFPPDQTPMLYPTRIPYEESSVFSQVNVKNPDLQRFPKFHNATPYIVTLEPGDVLYVPWHWWHYVECRTPAISINSWIELDVDDHTRVEEAITRTVTCNMLSQITDEGGTCPWLNPTEELTQPDVNIQYLQATVKKLKEADQKGQYHRSGGSGESSGPCRKKRKTSAEGMTREENSKQTEVMRRDSAELDDADWLKSRFLAFVERSPPFGKAEEHECESVACADKDREQEETKETFRDPSLEMLVECLTHPQVVNKVTELLKEKCSVK